jgi:transposase
MADRALASLSGEFEQMYSHTGRPSVPPEVLLKSLLLQILFSIRSNRLLVEQLGYNILYRWFLGLSLEERIWDHSTFSQNQERLIGTDIAGQFLQRIIEQAKEARLLSKDHFSVDGTLIDAWASIKSFQPRDGGPRTPSGRNDEVDFHGQIRKNDTHASTTDPESRLYRKGKGKESKLCYMGHTLMENRNGGAGCPGNPGYRNSRAGGSRRHDSEHPGQRTGDRWCGQGLRYGRIRGCPSQYERHAPCGSERHEPEIRH